MRKFLFASSLIVSLIVGSRIVMILLNDLDRLTNYGFGYLTGLCLLFTAAATLAVVLYIKWPKETS
jgi:hypothetical protein